MNRSAADLWLLGGITLILMVPFMNKAFHIDDVYFLEIAQNIQRTPMDPFSGATTLVDQDYATFQRFGVKPNTFATMSHPPLVPYYIALTIWLTGTIREWMLHFSFLIFPLICCFSMYSLAKVFTTSPFVATLVLISGPIFVVNSQNLMTDVPMLSFFLCALALFISGVNRDKVGLIALAGLIAGFAMLTRYVAFALLPLFLLYSLLEKRSVKIAILSIVVSAFIFGIWTYQNYLYHGSMHVIESSRHYLRFYKDFSFSTCSIAEKTISDLAGIGGTSVLLILLFLRNRMWLFYCCFAVASLLIVLIRNCGDQPHYNLMQLFAIAICCALGLFISAFVLYSARQSQDRKDHFLAFWFAGLLIASICMLPFGTPRYMLPLLPPAIFLAIGHLQHTKSVFRLLALACTFVLALLLAVSDYQYANVYRTAARNISNISDSKKVWFIGEWGFRYYMEAQGYFYLLSTDNSFDSKDLVVRPKIAGLHQISHQLQSTCRVIRSEDVFITLPIRILNPDSGAGFYAHPFGLLPFAISKTPVEHFDVLECADINKLKN
jgi:4-amino-4-deoxy-L-arabinose transferase-like glycosyltransferase